MFRFRIHLVLPLLLAPFCAQAAVIVGSNAVYDNGVQNLSTTGTLDWVYWNRRANTSVGTEAAPDNSKSGGALIGTAYVVGGTPSDNPQLRYSSNTSRPQFDFTFNDGVSPASGTVDDVMGVFNNDLNEFGAGVGVDITLPGTETYLVTVYVSGFNVNGRFTASLDGATTFNNTTYSSGDGERLGAYFQLEVTPDEASDVLSINFVQNTGGGSAHVMLAGVAISPIPEPGAPVLLSLALGGLLLMRRRRR